jgi:hypothetical protein
MSATSASWRGRWPIVRMLFTDHVAFLGLAIAAFAVVVVLITFGIALFAGDVTTSIWNGAVNFLRWLALGYGAYLTGSLLSVCVAHGRTRREFLAQVTLFMAGASALLALLLTLGYPLESLLYRAMDWQHQLPQGRLYTSPDQLGLIFLSLWAMLAVWTVAGAFISAGFSRDDGGWGLLMIPLAVGLVLLVAVVTDLGHLPFVSRVLRRAELPPAASMAVCAGAFGVGVAATWALVRDMPIKNKTA